MKGAGKSPFAAALCAIEMVGPCRPSGADEDGQPVGMAHHASWVQATAVTREQTRNVMQVMPAILSQRAIDTFQIDLGKELIYAQGGRCRMAAVTTSPRAMEGGRPTFCVRDETQHWLANNDGHAMADVIARNAAKAPGGSARVLSITNAHAPGQDSIAERDYDTWREIESGLAPADMLYDSVEAVGVPDLTDTEQLTEGVAAARSDSIWLDIPRIVAESLDPRTTAATVRRFYLNQIVAEEDKPFDAGKFAALHKPGYRIERGAFVTLGFDGSLSRDHTALIETEVETGFQSLMGYWEPSPDPATGELWIPAEEVDELVDAAFEQRQVYRLYADPYKWGMYISKWAGKYGADRVISWPTTNYKKMAYALAQYRVAIETAALSHDGDPRLVASIANAVKHMLNIRDDDDELMWVIQKERPDSPLKIDAAVAAALSWQARQDAIALGVNNVTTSVYERGEALTL